MAQTLSPLFGEFSTASTIARAAANRSGVVARPVLTATESGGTYSLGLSPNPSLGFWAWRTAWVKERGASMILEDALVQFATGVTLPTGANKRHILLVGRWKWVAGPIGGDGKPLGTFTEAMRAVYEAVSGADSTAPVDPAVPATDAAGRIAVVLARVVLTSTGATIEWLPETMLDLAEMGNAIEARHRKVGDEVHTGRFQVTESPTEDEDVVRRVDLLEQTVKSNASLVGFSAAIPRAWGSPPSVLTLAKRAESGTDVQFTTGDATMVTLETEGYYEIRGHTTGDAGPSSHDTRWELWLRPSGTAGAQDEMIAYNTFSNDAGGAPLAVYHLWSAIPGDKIYMKAVGKRSIALLSTVSYLGKQAATQPLTVTTADWSGMEANGQVYPKLIDILLTAQNATGAVTWTITGGTAQAFTTLNGAIATLSLPSTGTWTLQVKATDAALNEATKTINITLSAYAVVPLVITTGNQSFTAIGYPFDVEFPLASTGGEAPITWAVVVGANTTLPSAAITGSTATGTVVEAGTWTIEVRATDSAGTPQQVTKVITVAVADYTGGLPGGDDPWNPCFEAEETFVLMADGTGKVLAQVAPGEFVLGVFERNHYAGLRSTTTAQVTDKTMRDNPDTRPCVMVNGVPATPGHPFCVPKDLRRAEDLEAGDLVMTLRADGKAVETTPVEVDRGLSPVRVAANLKTRTGTYFVGPTAQGPWTLVHNIGDEPYYC